MPVSYQGDLLEMTLKDLATNWAKLTNTSEHSTVMLKFPVKLKKIFSRLLYSDLRLHTELNRAWIMNQARVKAEQNARSENSSICDWKLRYHLIYLNLNRFSKSLIHWGLILVLCVNLTEFQCLSCSVAHRCIFQNTVKIKLLKS